MVYNYRMSLYREKGILRQKFCLWVLINTQNHRIFCLMNMHYYGRKKESSFLREILMTDAGQH